MKTLIASVALATVIASPVLAQSTVRRAPAQQIQTLPQYNPAPTSTETQPRSMNPNAVYEGDQHLGADPDPNVRLMLRRDAHSWDF
jgi:hypothetical protein